MAQIVTVGSTTFQLIDYLPEAFMAKDEEGLVLVKDAGSIRKLEDYLSGKQIRTIFELGIFRGGSVAYFVELLNPACIVTVDIAPSSPALERWIDARNGRQQIKTHYNVDQADAGRLIEICSEAFGSAELDLIVDDASHELEKTRTSFNALFPLLRAGGSYIIEDWAWLERNRGRKDLVSSTLMATPPLSILVHELMIASASDPGLIEDLTINESFVAVRRGPKEAVHPFDIRHSLGENAAQS